MITDQIKELLDEHSLMVEAMDECIERGLPELANEAHTKKALILTRIQFLLTDLERQDAEQFKKIVTGAHSVSFG
jgi:hypothetical protein